MHCGCGGRSELRHGARRRYCPPDGGNRREGRTGAAAAAYGATQFERTGSVPGPGHPRGAAEACGSEAGPALHRAQSELALHQDPRAGVGAGWGDCRDSRQWTGKYHGEHSDRHAKDIAADGESRHQNPCTATSRGAGTASSPVFTAGPRSGTDSSPAGTHANCAAESCSAAGTYANFSAEPDSAAGACADTDPRSPAAAAAGSHADAGSDLRCSAGTAEWRVCRGAPGTDCGGAHQGFRVDEREAQCNCRDGDVHTGNRC